MQKNTLLSFISKYSLGGILDVVQWNISGNTIVTRFIDEHQITIGEVKQEFSNFLFEEEKNICIADSKLLVKMLSVLGDEIELKVTKKSSEYNAETLQISDGSTVINYMIADPTIVTNPPNAKSMSDPSYEFEFNKEEFIDKFIKAKAAFNDIDHFKISPYKKTIKISLGSSINKISMIIKSLSSGIPTRDITFNANYLREILSANKEAQTCIFSVYERGISKLSFNADGYIATYYLMEQQ
jgi:hypothetical protein